MRHKVQDCPHRRNAVQGLRDAFHHKVLASGNQLLTNTTKDYLCMENSVEFFGRKTAENMIGIAFVKSTR